MATANLPTPAASPLQLALNNFNALGQRQKLAIGAALAFAIALVVGVLLWSREPDYAVLFSNLEERDGGAIVTALQQQNVPYKFSEGGQAILVPAAQVHDVRLRLAAQGLPKGGLVGFELMENQKLGVSQFHEQINYQRALEGELARTIQSIAQVAAARVHLAIPRQTAFLRDDKKPSASVLVSLRPGRTLEPAQLAGIVHLISSSVPELADDNVSVIDQNGALLTGAAGSLRAAGLDATQLKYVQDLENTYIRRIESILSPLLGPGNFRAQVTTDVDFDQIEQTAETYKPNPSATQAIRSQQTSEQTNGGSGAQGVPGALTNQPPAPNTAPITDPQANGTAASTTQTGNTSRSSVTNYELDRTIQHVKQAAGQVKRMSVAVVVNYRTETLPNGKTKTVPITDKELGQITELVRQAVGFNQARGDTLNVASSSFAEPQAEQIPALPWWKDPEILSMAREASKYLVVLAAIALVYFGVLRPLMRSLAPPAQATEDEAEEEGGEAAAALEALPEAQVTTTFETKLQLARDLARSDPKLVANTIKEWMGVTEEAKK